MTPPHAWVMDERGTLAPDRRACGTHAPIRASFQKLTLQKGSPPPPPRPTPQKRFWGWRAGALLQPQLHRAPTEQNPGLSFLGSLWPNPAHVPTAGPPPAACCRASETKGSAGTMPLARLALCRAACGPPPGPPPSPSPAWLCPKRAPSPPSNLQVPFGCRCKSHILYAAFSSVRYFTIGF